MRSPPRDCPCHSGLRYAACCAPLHEDARAASAPTPEALMRSRYAAYALGLGEYLVATLARDHEDREAPRDALVRALSSARRTQRFMGLRVVRASGGPGDREGEVVFVATIFERGKDLSFAERSRFVRERGAWRYASGDTLAPEDLAAIEAGEPAPPGSAERA